MIEVTKLISNGMKCIETKLSVLAFMRQETPSELSTVFYKNEIDHIGGEKCER